MFWFTLTLGDKLCNDTQCSNGLTAPVMFSSDFRQWKLLFSCPELTDIILFYQSFWTNCSDQPAEYPQNVAWSRNPPQQCWPVVSWWFQFMFVNFHTGSLGKWSSLTTINLLKVAGANVPTSQVTPTSPESPGGWQSVATKLFFFVAW